MISADQMRMAPSTLSPSPATPEYVIQSLGEAQKQNINGSIHEEPRTAQPSLSARATGSYMVLIAREKGIVSKGPFDRLRAGNRMQQATPTPTSHHIELQYSEPDRDHGSR